MFKLQPGRPLVLRRDAWRRRLSTLPILVFCAAIFAGGCARQQDATQQDETALRRDPDLDSFVTQRDEGRYEEAFRLARAIVWRFPANGAAWNNVGYTAERLGKLDEAMDAYQRAVKVNPCHAKGWYNLGVMWGQRGRLSEEIKCYRRAVALRPSYYQAWRNLSVACAQAGKYREANDAYQKAAELEPKPAEAKSEEPPASSDSESHESTSRDASRREPSPSSARTEEAKTRDARPPLFRWNDLALVRSCMLATNAQPVSRLWGAETWKSRFERIGETASYPEIFARQLNNRGVTLEKRGEPDAAIQCYSQSLKMLGNDPMVWNNLGIAQMSAGRLAEAIVSLEESRRLSDSRPAVVWNLTLAHFRRAETLVRNNKASDATRHLQNALQMDSGFMAARLLLADILRRGGRWRDAQAHYEILTREFPNLAQAWFGFALAEHQTGNRQKVLDALANTIRLEPGVPLIWHWYGVEYALGERYEDAAVCLEKCVKLDPQAVQAWRHLGMAQARLKQWKAAIGSLQKAADLDPTAQSKMTLAAVYQAAGDSARLIAQCEAMLEKDPSQPGLWRTLGETCNLINHWEKALTACRKAVELDAQDGEAWAGMANALAELRKPKEAKAAYEKALAMGARRVDIWNNLGVTRARLGEYEEALEAFSQAARLSKNDPDILLNVGIVFHRQNRDAEALGILKQLQPLDAKKAVDLAEFIKHPN